MSKIVLVRIDDRLIHGQVMTAWVKSVRADKIIIVDDKVAADTFMQEVIKMVAPAGIDIEIYGVADGAQALMPDNKSNENILLLVKSPVIILSLIEKGVALKKLNVGGMGAAQGRKPLYRNISVSMEEKECFKKIMQYNVEIFLQIIPDEKSVSLKNLL